MPSLFFRPCMRPWWILQGNTDFSSVYARESGNEKRCYVLIAGDSGLAGGYNTNLFKCLEAASLNQDFLVLAHWERRQWSIQKRNGFACVTESFAEIADISVADCFEMANLLCGEFRKGRIWSLIFVTQSLFPCFLSSRIGIFDAPMTDMTDEQDTKSIRNLILYEPDARKYLMPLFRNIWQVCLWCGL